MLEGRGRAREGRDLRSHRLAAFLLPPLIFLGVWGLHRGRAVMGFCLFLPLGLFSEGGALGGRDVGDVGLRVWIL